MTDITCPYCGTEQEVNHDDGCGYDENEDHTHICSACSKEFIFNTTIMYHYSVMCQPYDHKLTLFKDNVYFCDNCDHSQVGNILEHKDDE